MDGLANYKLLKERISNSGDKNVLAQLALIKMPAFEEFRRLTTGAASFTLCGTTYTIQTRHSMSVDEKELVTFLLGGSCVLSVETNLKDDYFNVDVKLRQLDIVPHCAMLHVLAMI